MTFKIDERLQINTAVWFEGPLSTVLIKNERHYPWVILVPHRPAIEWYELAHQDQTLLNEEINDISHIIKEHFAPKKLNVASLGNQVSQLHIHIVGRNEADPLWPQGIWQSGYQSALYEVEEFNQLVTTLRKYHP